MHDAHEMFVADVPSPMKELAWMLPYKRAEERFERAVAERFGLPLPIPPGVRRLDIRARRNEVEEFLPDAMETVAGIRPLPVTLAPAWSSAKTRREFISEAASSWHLMSNKGYESSLTPKMFERLADRRDALVLADNPTQEHMIEACRISEILAVRELQDLRFEVRRWRHVAEQALRGLTDEDEDSEVVEVVITRERFLCEKCAGDELPAWKPSGPRRPRVNAA
jgi:hypothetical protein